MPRHLDGRTLAGRTGWDVVLQFPGVGQEPNRGSVLICTHPKLPGWAVGHKGRGWALVHVESKTVIRFVALWQAIEAGNKMFEWDTAVKGIEAQKAVRGMGEVRDV